MKMPLTVYPSDVLESRVRRWLAQIARDKPDSLPCNLPVSFVSCDGPGMEITYRFDTDRRMENPWGVTHGGVLALAMDWVMGATARVVLDRNDTPTISMQIDYLKPVPLSRALYLRVFVDHAGKTVSHLCARGSASPGGPCLVSGSGHYYMGKQPLLFHDEPPV